MRRPRRAFADLLFLAAAFLALTAPALAESPLNAYLGSIVDLNTGLDKPRSIDKPKYISVADASLTLEPRDVVFVVEPGNAAGGALILPHRIMVHHEIVNFDFNGQRASVVYSPLAGSVRGFKGRVDGGATSFGTTGLFINSFRLIYDRASGSFWLPMTGAALDGPLSGSVLTSFPVVWTTWERARAVYPEAQVLTGGRAVSGVNYERDPYGSYLKDDTYYQTGGSFFPLAHTDRRLKLKDVVVVPATGNPKLALLYEGVARAGILNVEQGITRVVAFHDPKLGAVRMFEPYAAGHELTFGYKNGVIFDHQTRSKWSLDGVAIEGRLRGRVLEPIESERMFWFVWAAFYPDSLLAGD